MDSARWERVQAVFYDVVDLPKGQQRACLEAFCGDDASLLAEVSALLEEDVRRTSLLDRNVGALAQQVLDPPAPTRFAEKVGPYKIRRLLGEGGMGAVYLAEREDLGSLVAIKFLRDAWMSPARRERFTNEQRTLAQLNHPAIARLYDAKMLADGTPYFVMEYVDGSSITDYCRERRASIDERLRLFRSVCEAVHYAHQNVVIHRDLKPSNIFVKPDGTVRLLDFGIAKQLESLTEPVDQTRTELRLMTPAYAAPEQIRGEGVGILTDVYALGVVLYELLAQKHPFDLSSRTPGEVERLVLEQEPEKPSAATREAAKRSKDLVVPSAGKSAWADLDVLCLTAMHKDPQRRYRSVEALIRDIDHYLAGEPLEARPDQVRYKLGKFIKRNRRAVLAAAAVLIVGIALAAYFTLRLANARDAALAAAARAERIQQFMLKLFDAGDSDAGPSQDLRVVTLLDRGVKEAQSLNAEPAVQADLYQTLGGLYQRLGNFDRADQLLRLALDQRKVVFGSGHSEVAKSLVALGLLRSDQARFDEAEKLIREGLEVAKRARPPDELRVAEAMAGLGKVLQNSGQYNEAIPVSWKP